MSLSLVERNRELMATHRICLLIPTYNNAPLLSRVLSSVLPYCADVVVVNDGSTDTTSSVLQSFENDIHIVGYSKNRGKGFALKYGFDWARSHHFNAALTFDSDGQHLASDIPLLVNQYVLHPHSVVVGCRSLQAENMPTSNTFANRFSNFWFALQTGIRLSDTQTGFRLYPLQAMGSMHPYFHRYEAELELLVRMAWRNLPFSEVPIHVYYPPSEERISHFRPTIDFIRISLLNVLLCVGAILYGYPSRAIRFILNTSRS